VPRRRISLSTPVGCGAQVCTVAGVQEEEFSEMPAARGARGVIKAINFSKAPASTGPAIMEGGRITDVEF